jgi:hypothetical protein
LILRLTFRSVFSAGKFNLQKWMKVALAICLFALSIATSTNIMAQKECETHISIVYKDCRLDNVLDSIESLAKVRFSYNSELVPKNSLVTVSLKDVSICTVLDSLFSPLNLSWTRIENQVVINSKEIVTSPLPSPTSVIPAFVKVTGKIIDKADKEPIPYVYLRILGKNVGTITNEDGQFVLKYIPDKERDLIAVSCIGYKTLAFPLNELIDGNTIILQKESILLKEVLIRSNDPKAIIRKSIEAIPANYSNSAVQETGFYRETLLKNNRYVVLSEAIVNIFKSSYTRSLQMDQVKVFKGRKSADKSQYDTVLFKLQGGLYNCLLLDIVKRIPSFMDESDFSLYDYKMGLIQKINDEMAYTIEFDQKDGVTEPYYKGKLFVEVNSLAIIGAEFSLSPKAIENAGPLLVKKAPLHLRVKPIAVDYLVNFDKVDGKWQLNHIRVQIQMRVRKRSKLFNSLYTSVAEMVITATDSLPAKPFRYSETAHSNDVFIDLIGPYDPSFWGEYNYIKPEEKLEETLQRLFPKPSN